MNTHSHLEESLQRGIDEIRRKVIDMAGLSERALQASVRALVERNRSLAYSVILRDSYIDELEMELDRLCLEFLVRHQPAGRHLRLIFATIQINRQLERVGDYAESVARQVLGVSSLEPQPPYTQFVELGEIACQMLRDAVQSFLQQDAELAARTMALEEQANALRNRINADLGERSRTQQLPAGALNPLMTIARRLERTADQAKNLCEEVLYLCTGEFRKHQGTDAFRILFVDADNACLSQMAEAIGRSLNLPRFVFHSAGLAPRPLDPRAVQFLTSKGLDLSGQSSKSVQQVPQWEQLQVIVALGGQDPKGLPATAPNKTVVFSWPMPDPAQVQDSPSATQSALESAYQCLQTHIRELVGAIREEPKTKEGVEALKR